MKIVVILTCLFMTVIAQYNPPQFTTPSNSYSTVKPQEQNPPMPGFGPG